MKSTLIVTPNSIYRDKDAALQKRLDRRAKRVGFKDYSQAQARTLDPTVPLHIAQSIWQYLNGSVPYYAYKDRPQRKSIFKMFVSKVGHRQAKKLTHAGRRLKLERELQLGKFTSTPNSYVQSLRRANAALGA